MIWGRVLEVRERMVIAGCAVRVVRADGIVSPCEDRACHALLRCLDMVIEDPAWPDMLDADARALPVEVAKMRGIVRRMAYAAGNWASLADGVVNEAELAVLADLRARLDIPCDVATRIAERVRTVAMLAHDHFARLDGDRWATGVDVVLSGVLSDYASEPRAGTRPARPAIRHGQAATNQADWPDVISDEAQLRGRVRMGG